MLRKVNKGVMTCEALQVEIFQQLVSCYESEDEEFLHDIATANEIRLLHYEAETKSVHGISSQKFI